MHTSNRQRPRAGYRGGSGQPGQLDHCGRRSRRLVAGLVCALVGGLLLAGGCARYNTFYNAEKAFNEAERAREEAIKSGEDIQRATTGQRANYQRAIAKSQKVLDEYPGHSLSDNALFLQGKAHHRLASYRMSIRQLDLLFTNFPQTPYLEEALYLQAVNHLMINDAGRSQNLLDRLERQFPESRFQAEALRASGDNAHTLRDWEEAVRSYRRYLESHPEADNWDLSSLNLAESLWELHRYEEAVPILQRVIDQSPQADRSFRARLLLARCLIRLGQLDEVEAMIPTLRNEAEIQGEQGRASLVEAENLLARGQRGTAMTLLEDLPQEWLTREVKPRWADLLGYAYLASDELDIETLEKARDYFQQTTGGSQILEDPDRTQRLFSTIRDYLAATNQLPNAQPDRAARLRLTQANALLFGFDRPEQAYDLFVQVAADTAADTTLVPRALYGAMLLQETHFGQPDSAAHYAQLLQDGFPDSPQAYQARSGVESDLLSFLLQQELAAQRIAAEERGESMFQPQIETRPGSGRGSGLRRQMIYLQHRSNLVFEPPPAAVAALAGRREGQLRAAQEALREADSSPSGPAAGSDADTLATAPPETSVVHDAMDHSVLGPAPVDTLEAAPPDSAAEIQPEPEPEPKKERPRSWDF